VYPPNPTPPPSAKLKQPRFAAVSFPAPRVPPRTPPKALLVSPRCRSETALSIDAQGGWVRRMPLYLLSVDLPPTRIGSALAGGNLGRRPPPQARF